MVGPPSGRSAARGTGAPRRRGRLRGARAPTSADRLPHRLLITGSAADAEDAAQEAFVKAWRALARFRAGAPFRPWLLAIVANEARTAAARRAAARAGRARGAAAETSRRRTEPLAPEAACSRRAPRSCCGALARLDERDRTVLALRYLLDLPEREIAAVLGCRPRNGQVAAVAGARAPARGGGGVSDALEELRALGAALEWPETPDLVPAVRARMAPAPAPRRRWRPHGPLALAAAVCSW